MTTDKAQKVRHTKLPWKAEYDESNDRQTSIMAGDTFIAQTAGLSFDGDGGDEEDLANGEFICQAANSFEKLLEAAKGLLSEVEPVIKGGAPAILNGGSAYLRIAFNSLQLIVREAEGRP